MENRKSIGLPGGPNEFLKEITQHISVEGYKRYSEDVNNPYNIIESGNITMEDVDFPVKGTDNLGNEQMMMPGMNYQFPGDSVLEVPMAQTGYEVPKRNGVRDNGDGSESTHLMATETLDGKNWFSFPTLFQDPDGTWIDMSTKPWKEAYKEAERRGELIDFGTDKESAIKFGKGSWKPKAQDGSETAPIQLDEVVIKADKEKSSLNKWGHGILDAAGLVPGFGEIADGVNALWYAAEGDNTNAALSTAAMVPFLGWGATATKFGLKGVKALKGTKNIAKEVLENTVKVADDVKPSWSRGVTNYGDSPQGIQDALTSMKSQGKHLDEIGFNVDDVIAPNVINHGNKFGRQIAEVALPNGQSQLFYKSSGLAGKKGIGKGGTTEGLWQPYGGHASANGTNNWFIKDIGYENFYDSNSFKGIANKLDEIESGWDMSKQVLKSKLKYGGIPKAQDGNGEYKSEDITKEGFDWGGYFSGEQGWIPDYDGVPTLQMFDEQPVKQEVVEKAFEKKPKELNIEGLKKGISQAESLSGLLMLNPESTATGLYGQRFSEIKGKNIYKGSREAFAKDIEAQNKVFELRLNQGIDGKRGLIQDAEELYNEYQPQIKNFEYSKEDLIALSNFLGRQGTRNYLGYHIRDGKPLTEALPNLYGSDAKQVNKIPSEYLKVIRGYYQYGGSNLPNYQLKGEVNYNWKSADLMEKYRTPIDNTYVNIPLQRFESINNKKETDSKREYVPFNVMDMPQMQQAQDNTYVYKKRIENDKILLSPEEIEERDTRNKILDREYNDPRDPWVSNAIKNANDFKTGWKDYSNAPEEEIKKLQQELINNGYDVGSTKDDGVFGSKTQAAYSAMVEDKNLDLKSVDRYFGDYSTKNKEEVMQIQNQLIDLGFLPEKELDGKTNLDGKFGPRTKEALLEYNTTLNEEDSSALIFDFIPSKLEDPRCASGMCAILEKNNVQTEALGIKYKDAWDILENMKISKNSEVLFNIYDEPEFANVNQNTSVEELKNITNKVKQRKQTNKSDYKVGDIIGIYWPGSDKHNQTLNSKTFNTHTGFVSDIDEKGNPIITHNVNGKVKQQPYTQLQTSWIARPNEDIKLNTTYDVAGIENISNDLGPILNLENKWGAKISVNRGNQIQNILKRATYNADKIPQILNSSVDNEWLKHATFAITGVESGIGKDDVTPRTLEEAGFNSGIKQLAYKYKGTKPEDVSLGIGKIKYSTLDGFEKEYFNIDSYKDLADDNKSTDLVSYRLTKNYEIFKDYAKQYPELGLSEEDIRNMSILAHNQGNSKLLQIGKSATSVLLPAEQVKELRKLYEGTINDVSSTNYKYIPGGEKIYNAALAIGAEDEAIPYIRKVNNYINQVFQPMSSTAIASVSSAQKQDPFSKQSMAKGGEYGVFNNYINGDYNNTLREAAAEKVYDKLNRLHYKDAKALGMSPANYILTHVMAKA